MPTTTRCRGTTDPKTPFPPSFPRRCTLLPAGVGKKSTIKSHIGRCGALALRPPLDPVVSSLKTEAEQAFQRVHPDAGGAGLPKTRTGELWAPFKSKLEDPS